MTGYDVIVVGAGPAGTAAALGALRGNRGARVLLVDKEAFPRDKACGDGIAPHGLEVLADLGVKGVTSGYEGVSRLRLRGPGGTEAAGLIDPPNYVIPRRIFDARLVDASVAAGAQLVRARVRCVDQDGAQLVVNRRWSAPVLVAADGANSTVRRLVGVPRNPPAHLALAVRGYASEPNGAREQRICMVADGWPAYFWSFPIGDGRANVGFGLLREGLRGGREELHGRLARLLPEQPADASTLRAHHLPLSSWRPRPAHKRVLLAGDAASLINPLTGEGIFYALLSGRLAGEAATSAPERAGRRYEQSLRRALGRHLRHTAALARLLRRRRFADAALEAARHRQVFGELVEIGLGRGAVSIPTAARVAAALRNS